MIPDKQNQDDVKAKRSGPITKSVVMDSKFVSDLTIPDGMLVAPGQALTKKWLVKNSGCFPWPAGTVLALAKSTKFTSVSHASTDSVVYPGTTAELEVALTAPAETGKHLASFQLWRLEDNKPFGDEFWASVEVVKFPSVGQLKKLALDFIADSKNVAILQSELPALLSDLSNGRRLAVIVDSLLERNPSLLN